jgi:hypothetical protein
MNMANENLGPAERIIQSLLTYTDHAYHGRPGYVIPNARLAAGVQWFPVTHKVEGEAKEKVVYRLDKVGRKTRRTRVGVLQENNQIKENGRVIGEYRPSGMFSEVATWMYSQVAEVWKLDNEFAAKWASYAFGQEHEDLKVALAAFMLCQSRKGDPVVEDGKLAFHDEDYREVGEAMVLIGRKDQKNVRNLDPKLILRIQKFLKVPGVMKINHDLGFSKSTRNPFYGRWKLTVTLWLKHREENPKILEGLVKDGWKSTVMELARQVNYKPESGRFFQILSWNQEQSEQGHRTVALDKHWEAAETWEGQTEEAICQRIVGTKPNWKVIVSKVPKSVGITRAIMTAAIEARCLSNKDLIVVTPTLEDLGLLQVQEVRERWEQAVRMAEDQRGANIALRVKSKATQEKLQEAADTAVKKAVEEVTKGLRVYFIVDISGSMDNAIEAAKRHLAKFLQGFPQDKTHVSVFSTVGREIQIKHASAAGITNAFRGIMAGGGTDYGSGVKALQKYQPAADEDSLFIFVGDEEASRFTVAVQQSGLRPMAFGFLKVRDPGPRWDAVTGTAAELGIPCFMIEEQTFEDPYAIPRTIRALVAATPVGVTRQAAVPRVTLVDTILQTELLKKPAWAA